MESVQVVPCERSTKAAVQHDSVGRWEDLNYSKVDLRDCATLTQLHVLSNVIAPLSCFVDESVLGLLESQAGKGHGL